jgi:hypothetical protein
MDDAKNKCKSGIQQAEKDCEDALRAAEDWLKKAAETIAKPFKAIGKLFGRRRRRAINMLHSNTTSTVSITGVSMRRPVVDLISRDDEQVPKSWKIRHRQSYGGFSLKLPKAHYQTSFAQSSNNDVAVAKGNQRYTLCTLISL